MKKRILSLLLTLCMVVSVLPTAVFAEGNDSAASTEQMEVAPKTSQKVDPEGSTNFSAVQDENDDTIDVLLIGNSHAVDIETWLSLVLRDAGLDSKVKITRLAPMGGRKLYTDDSDRSSHIAAATTEESAWPTSGKEKQNKSYYDAQLLNANKTWDLIIVQDWHESTVATNSETAVNGIRETVNWLKSCTSYQEGKTRIAWAADWPDAASHESAHDRMVNAVNAVSEMTDGVNFIIPVGLCVENARTSYFNNVKNADDSYLPGSENTDGSKAEVANYNLMERDANHLSYELGCYTVAAMTVAKIVEQYNLMSVTDFLASLKTAPEYKDKNGVEWKGSFNDNIWAVVKESVSNAIQYPKAVTQSQYTVDPADQIAEQVKTVDCTDAAEKASAVSSQEELEAIAAELVAKAGGAANAELTPVVTYSAPVDGTEDNKTGTAGKYYIGVKFLCGYTQKEVALVSGEVKPKYYEGGEEELAAAVKAAKTKLTGMAAALGVADNSAYIATVEAALCVADVNEALANAQNAMVKDAGYEAAGSVTSKGWDKQNNNAPVGDDTGVYYTIKKDGNDVVLAFVGEGSIPDFNTSNGAGEWSATPWRVYNSSKRITKVVVGGKVSVGQFAILLTNVSEIKIEDGAELRENAIYFNTMDEDSVIRFEGTAKVASRSIGWYNKNQPSKTSQSTVYADFSKLTCGDKTVQRATDFVEGGLLTTNNANGLPIVQVKNTDPNAKEEDTTNLESGDVTTGGWDANGTAQGNPTGVKYRIYSEGTDVILELSGNGEMPKFDYKEGSPHYNNTPWRKDYGTAITKVVVDSGVTVDQYGLFLSNVTSYVIQDGAGLKTNAIYFNTQKVNATITFEGSATVASNAISWYNGGGQKGLPVQVLVRADFARLTKKESEAQVAVASDFIASDLLTTKNMNGDVIVVAVNTNDEKKTLESGKIYDGGWNKTNREPLGTDTGVSYEIYTQGTDVVLEFKKDGTGSGIIPNYGAKKEALDWNNTAWVKSTYYSKVSKVIIGSGVTLGTDAVLFSNLTRIEIAEGASLARDSIYLNGAAKDCDIVFLGNATVVAGSIGSYVERQMKVASKPQITVYADLTKLGVSGPEGFIDSSLWQATYNDSDKKIIVFYGMGLEDAAAAIRSDKAVIIAGFCGLTDDAQKAEAVQSYAESKIKADSITCTAKKVISNIYDVTLTLGENGPTKTVRITVNADHQYKYTAQNDTITASCTNCSNKVVARVVANNVVEGNAKNAVFVSYGAGWPAGNLTITYSDPAGNIYDGMPTGAGTYCASISVENVKASATFAISHNLVKHEKVDATCTTEGSAEYWNCTVCNKNFEDQAATKEITDIVIPKVAHTLTKTDAVAATCTTDGNKEYWTCSECHKLFRDENGTTETTPDDVTIKAKGHDLKKTEAKAATCTEAGTKAYWTCSVCNKVFADVEGTHETTVKDQVIPATGHALTKTDAKDATCTEAGNKAYWTCSVCGKVFADEAATTETTVEKMTVAATGHDWSNADGVCKTCGTKCTEEHKPGTTCSVCGKNTAEEDKTPDEDKTPSITDFTDVKSDDWFYDSVKWALDRKITNGTSETTYSPAQGCTRAQIVTFLWRAFGEPEPTTTENPFTDVTQDENHKCYYKAILWAAEKGITTGTTETTFSPNEYCTRAQIVTFLYRAAGKPEPKGGKMPFEDVKQGDYYYNAVLWACENGIAKGMTATTFEPGTTCTRAQSVTFVYRAEDFLG